MINICTRLHRHLGTSLARSGSFAASHSSINPSPLIPTTAQKQVRIVWVGNTGETLIVLPLRATSLSSCLSQQKAGCIGRGVLRLLRPSECWPLCCALLSASALVISTSSPLLRRPYAVMRDQKPKPRLQRFKETAMAQGCGRFSQLVMSVMYHLRHRIIRPHWQGRSLSLTRMSAHVTGLSLLRQSAWPPLQHEPFWPPEVCWDANNDAFDSSPSQWCTASSAASKPCKAARAASAPPADRARVR